MIKHTLVITVTIFSLCFLNPHTSRAEDNEGDYELSKEDSEMVFEMSEKFSQCAGMLKATAWLLGMAGKTESQKDLEGSYRGWYLSGAYMLFSTGAVKDWELALNHSEAITQNTEQKYRADFELEPDGFIERIDNLFGQECKPYIEYQTSLVTQMRRAMATASPDNEK